MKTIKAYDVLFGKFNIKESILAVFKKIHLLLSSMVISAGGQVQNFLYICTAGELI